MSPSARPTGHLDPPAAPLGPDRLPYRLDGAAVADAFGTGLDVGLTTTQVENRLAEFGRNELAEAPRTPRWRRFLGQFTDRLILILLGAAAIAFLVSGELKTPLVVLTVVVVNAVLGFVQEQRAEKSLDALRQLVVRSARVVRNGEQLDVAAEELVPGDVVTVEAGDKVPADGRLVITSTLEVDEAILTGESVPVDKAVDAIATGPVPVGDRDCMVHMNSTVTRGRGTFIVTSTGMATEIGRIAGLISSTNHERTPLQRQLDALANSLAKLAGIIVLAVFAIGLLRGETATNLMLTAVALAVAAIPEGLPAVTAVTLAIGVSKMAKQNAIVKRLASVETLGCTSVICSDKTGTLTLNEMTATELFVPPRSYEVSGRGYAPIGEIEGSDGGHVADPSILEVLRAMALCNDATIRRERPDGEWQLVGDPTEGALTVLATKAGIDVNELRARTPRRLEIPFDSATKVMATAHEQGDGMTVIYVKGAPDVLVARSIKVVGHDHQTVSIDDARRELADALDAMASAGLRVLGVARRTLTTERLDAETAAHDGAGAAELLHDLTLLGLVGIVDPPRPEARDAIAVAHEAGITVKMITGDHAATAKSIAGQLGLNGDIASGAELDDMDDDELRARVRDIAVFARVSPDHKLRVVSALQSRGDIVAMTGDGVNDAPALKQADIGVAMGITGTEVTKEAATMILTDDNFATIVRAVRQGRTIYDNIVKFVRFQLSTTIGFAALFLLSGVFGVAGGKPFTAIGILWVNLVMDGPPAMALGVDPAGTDTMQRRPRPIDEPILTRPRWWAIGTSATVMAVGTLAVLSLTPGDPPQADVATVAGTMAFNTFVIAQFFNILNVRSDRVSVFDRSTLTNRWLWLSLGAVLALQVGVTHVGVLQDLFETTSISATDWAVCVLVASTVLWAEELQKLFARRRNTAARIPPTVTADSTGGEPHDRSRRVPA